MLFHILLSQSLPESHIAVKYGLHTVLTPSPLKRADVVSFFDAYNGLPGAAAIARKKNNIKENMSIAKFSTVSVTTALKTMISNFT